MECKLVVSLATCYWCVFRFFGPRMTKRPFTRKSVLGATGLTVKANLR
jgi:hypothetical protein